MAPGAKINFSIDFKLNFVQDPTITIFIMGYLRIELLSFEVKQINSLYDESMYASGNIIIYLLSLLFNLY